MRSASLRAFITSTTVLVALASYAAAGSHAHHRSTPITGPGFNRDDDPGFFGRMGKDERNDFLTKDNNPEVQGSAFGRSTAAQAGSNSAASQRPVLVPSATPSRGISPIPSATPGGTHSSVSPIPSATPGGTHSSVSPIPSATPGGTHTAPSPGGAAIGPIIDDPNAMVTPKTQIPSATSGGTRSSVSPIPSATPGRR